MTNDPKGPSIADMFKPRKYGIAAKREAAQAKLKDLKPEDMGHKLAIIFDDSGSMGGQPIKDAHAGVRGFTNSCNPLDTSIAVYPLNDDPKPLTCNYDLLNMLVSSIKATGGTHLYTKTMEMLNDPKNYTRGILFSDGEPTDDHRDYSSAENEEDGSSITYKEKMIRLAVSKKTPLDTIFIGLETSEGFKLMKEIAEKTGGIFIHFKDAASLSSGLKYLAPGLRGLLANPDIKAKIERGESI